MLHFSYWGKGHSGVSKVPSHLILCLCLACGVVSLGFSLGVLVFLGVPEESWSFLLS